MLLLLPLLIVVVTFAPGAVNPHTTACWGARWSTICDLGETGPLDQLGGSSAYEGTQNTL